MPTTNKTTGSINPTDPLLLERLEYGKFCATPDGPTISETVGHRQLGWTNGFPPELKSLCTPAVIGVSASELEDLPRQCPHGTVLRPAGLRGRAAPILCRVRKRPENGEGTESRLYTLARYLVAPPERSVEPLSLFKAMGPLRGITEDEARALTPIVVEPGDDLLQRRLESKELMRQARRFAQEALIYVMSGIPVSIAEQIEEEEFFTLVTVLWRMLPSWLRPSLSAGWGVSASLSGKLAVTYARQQAEVCTTFSRGGDGKWKWWPPREAPGYGRREREAFQREHVASGAHYAWYLYGCEPYRLPKIESFDEPMKAEELLKDALPDAYSSGARQLDFDNPEVAGLFLTPGLDARDRYLCKNWERYLTVRPDENDNDLAEPSSDFTFAEHKLKAFSLVRDALKDAGRREQADALLWYLVASADPDLFTNLNDSFGVARLRLFKAIKQGDPRELLEALYQSAEEREAYRLPGGAREALDQCLKSNLRTFDEKCARLHTSLLDMDEPPAPPDYLDWVKRHGFELALGVRGSGNEWADALYRRIRKIPDSSRVRMLLSWEDGREPTTEDEETFRNLDAEVRRRFFDQLVSRWKGYRKDSAGSRERLLPWLRLAWEKGQGIDDPLLALVFGKEPEVNDLEILAAGIELQAAPASLERQVAKLILKHYPWLAPRVRQDVKRWSAVIRHLPADVSAALFPGTEYEQMRGEAADDGDEGYWEAERLKFKAEELEQLIKDSSQTQPIVLRWYWRWAKYCDKPDPKSETPVVRICKYVMGHGALSEIPMLKYSDIERARQLAEADGESLPELKSKAEVTWGEKDREIAQLPEKWLDMWEKNIAPVTRREYLINGYTSIGKELVALLHFFPDVDFIPTTRQLEVLLGYRHDIEKHLERKEAIHPNRPGRFRLLTAQPMQLDYDEIVWNDEYAGCHFWMVFKGVPVQKQLKGSLGSALDFYYGEAPRQLGSQREEYLVSCAEVCRTYLNSYSGSELREALKRVLDEFVIRWLDTHERRDEEEIRLILINAPITRNNPFWDLVKMIRRFGENKIISRAIDNYFRVR